VVQCTLPPYSLVLRPCAWFPLRLLNAKPARRIRSYPSTISSISLQNHSTPVGRRVRILEIRRRWCQKEEEIIKQRRVEANIDFASKLSHSNPTKGSDALPCPMASPSNFNRPDAEFEICQSIAIDSFQAYASALSSSEFASVSIVGTFNG